MHGFSLSVSDYKASGLNVGLPCPAPDESCEFIEASIGTCIFKLCLSLFLILSAESDLGQLTRQLHKLWWTKTIRNTDGTKPGKRDHRQFCSRFWPKLLLRVFPRLFLLKLVQACFHVWLFQPVAHEAARSNVGMESATCAIQSSQYPESRRSRL